METILKVFLYGILIASATYYWNDMSKALGKKKSIIGLLITTAIIFLSILFLIDG